MLAISLAQTFNVNHLMVSFPPVKYAIRVHVLPAYAVLTHNSCHKDLLRFYKKTCYRKLKNLNCLYSTQVIVRADEYVSSFHCLAGPSNLMT